MFSSPVNLLVGSQSSDRKDWNADGQVDDPSDGYGLLLNGQNLGYLQAAYTEADAAVKAAGASENMRTSGESFKASVENLALWTDQLKPLLISILSTSSRADLRQAVTEASTLSAKILDGIDVDEDGVVEAITGEGGARAAYEQAYRMADMPLQTVGILNVGTGTPTFVLIAPSNTSGGGGGSTGGSTQQAPPGQQKTARPSNDNKPPQKTKKPTGNNTTSSTTTDNTNKSNGNDKNGN